MTTEWASFIQAQTNALTDDIAALNRLADGDILCALTDYRLTAVAGPDAADFMQGQFTNDVRQVNDERMQLSAYCNNKGRMLANFCLFRYQQHYFISLYHDLQADFIETLSRYVLRAQVGILDVTDQLVHLAISGVAVSRQLARLLQDDEGLTLRSEPGQVTAGEHVIVLKTTDAMPRYEIFVSPDKAIGLWQRLAEAATVTSERSWAFLNIHAGIPVLRAATAGEWVPQMANLDRLDAINFKKGCYTGQEIVARMHYLGKLKKRMYRIHITGADSPRAGDTLTAENARAGQNTGMIVDAQPAPDGGHDALAVLQMADVDNPLHLAARPDSRIRIESLPYSLSESSG